MHRTILGLVCIATLAACAPEKEALSPQAAQVNQSIEMYAPAGFDWKNHQDCTLELNGNKGMVEINTLDGAVIARMLCTGGPCELRFTVPNHIREVSVAFNGVRTPMNVRPQMKWAH